MAEDHAADRAAVLLQRIQGLYPDLGTATVRLIDEGAFNDLLVVDETYIFRFPRSADGVQRLGSELIVLRALQGHTLQRTSAAQARTECEEALHAVHTRRREQA